MISDKVRNELNERFKWALTNVSNLESPVLVVFDYSPVGHQEMISIAFDCCGANKCWLSAEKVLEIDGDGPNSHPSYQQFTVDGQTFKPYSIVAFPSIIFEDVSALSDACRRLYKHVDWS